MTKNTRLLLLASTIVAGTAASTAAFAQAAPADDTKEIVVTGSLIRNPNLTASSPVSVINSTEIKLQQTPNAEELLRGLPSAVANIGANVNNGNGGASYVDLRGLGPNRNIVLLDGARIVPAGTNGQVDLNNIPVALIERVETLTGGASTTYGADAVSGVVNFITKKHFSGFDLQASKGITSRGDGQTFNTTLTVGGNFAENRGNAVLSLGYDNQDPIYQGARDFSVFAVDSVSGVAAGASSTGVPTAFSFPTVKGKLQVDPTGTLLVPQYLKFNFNPYNILTTPVKKISGYAAANYDVSDTVEVYSRAMFSRNTISTIVAPSGIFGSSETIPGNNPYLTPAIRDAICTADKVPLGDTCNTNTALLLPAVYRRSVELGPRVDQYQTDIFDVRAGLKFNITKSIVFDLYGAYGESTNTQTRLGYVSNSRVQQALNATSTTSCNDTSNGCVPLNLFGPAGSITAAQAAFIGGITSSIARGTTLGQVHGVVSGDLFNLPGATKPVTFAVGGEYRKYTAAVNPDNLAQVPGELGGAGGAILPVSGAYDVTEGFGELNAPLVTGKPLFEELTLEGGLRYSSYKVRATGSPSFNATTYKGGLTWAPTNQLKFRGTYAHAVRAPNIGELFAPPVTGLTNLTVDPCSGTKPVGNAKLTAICLGQGAPLATIGNITDPAAGQANETGGGNPNLKPEVADTYTLGFVLQPKAIIPGFTLTADYYNIVVNGAITTPTPGDVINACFGNITDASATSTACTSIRRSPANGSLSGSPATVPGIPLALSNSGRLATDGVDLTISYNRRVGSAKLNATFNGNWTDHSRFQSSSSSVNRDCVGYYSANCGSIQPKFQWNERTSLDFGNVGISLLWRHLDAVNYEPLAAAAGSPLFSGTIVNGAGATGTGVYSPLGGTVVNFNHIKAYDYFDLSGRVNIAKHFEVIASVKNLFDRQPPVVGATAGTTAQNSGNTYPSTYDPVGRDFNVTARITF